MNATDSALKSFGNVWKFRKRRGTGPAGNVYKPCGWICAGKGNLSINNMANTGRCHVHQSVLHAPLGIAEFAGDSGWIRCAL